MAHNSPSSPLPVTSAAIAYAASHETRRTRKTGPPSLWRWGLAVLYWALTGGLFIGLASGAIGMALGLASGGLIGVVIMLLWLGSTAFILRAVRQARAAAAVNYLTQAVHLNLPLPLMLQAAERGERSGMRRSLARLRRWLEDGQHLAVALPHAFPGVPRRVAAAIDAGETAGRLRQALMRNAEQARISRNDHSASSALLYWYPLLFFPIFFFQVFFYTELVAPKILHVLRDYELSPPPITEWSIIIGNCLPSGSIFPGARFFVCSYCCRS